MRPVLAFTLVGLVGTTTLAGPARYLVVPTDHAVNAGTRPCRAALSADGLVVAFDAYAAFDSRDRNGRPDVYLLDRATNRVTLVSRTLSGGTGRGSSRCPTVSNDGQHIAFESDVSDLIEGDVPGSSDVFVFDRRSATLRRIVMPASAGPSMCARPALSADGRLVVFDASVAGATPDERRRVYRVTVDTGVVEVLGDGYDATVSSDGSLVAFVTSVRPGQSHIQVVGPEGTRTLERTKGRSADGDTSAPALSADGQWIAYVSRPTPSTGGRQQPARTQVYVERLDDGVRHLVSATHRGDAGNGLSILPSIDATGARVVFESTATTLGCGSPGLPACDRDINLLADVYLWERATRAVTRVNTVTSELPWLEGAAFPAISPDGRTVAFLSRQPVNHADGRDTFDLFVTTR